MRPGRMGTHCRHVAGADLILERLAFGLGALGRIYLERSAVFQLVQLPLLLISRLSQLADLYSVRSSYRVDKQSRRLRSRSWLFTQCAHFW